MPYDVTSFSLGKGTLRFTPPTGPATTIGFAVDGVQLTLGRQYWAHMPEGHGESPDDYIDLGGPVIARGIALQWDDATRALIGPHFMTGNALVMGVGTVGRRQSSQGLLTSVEFEPEEPGALRFQSSRGLVVSGIESSLELDFHRSRHVRFAWAIALSPDFAGRQVEISAS